MTSACAALPAIDATEGVLYSFNRTAAGVSLGGYNIKAINTIFDAFKADGYFSAINYKQYQEKFAKIFNGPATDTAEARAHASRQRIATLSAEDMPHLTFFMQKTASQSPRFMVERIQDGTLQATINRVAELGPRPAIA